MSRMTALDIIVETIFPADVLRATSSYRNPTVIFVVTTFVFKSDGIENINMTFMDGSGLFRCQH